MKRSLTILDSLQIETPCHESWENMAGDERSRFCAQCAYSVINLSAHTKDDATALLTAKAGSRVCVRFVRGADGAIKFRKNISRGKVLRKGISVLFASLVTFFGFSPEGMTQDQEDLRSPPPSQHGERVMMGELVAMPTPSPTPEPRPEMGKVVRHERSGE